MKNDFMAGRNSVLPSSKEATMEDQVLKEHLVCAPQSTNGETETPTGEGTYTVYWVSS